MQGKYLKPKKVPTFRKVLFFLLAGAYQEILLNLSDGIAVLTPIVLLRILLSGAALGASIWFIGSLIPHRTTAKWITGLLLFAVSGLFIAERCCRAFFGTFFQVSFMLKMSGQVAGGFLDDTIRTIVHNLWYFGLSLLPVALFALFSYDLMEGKREWKASGAAMILMTVLAVLSCHVGGDWETYTTDFNTNTAVPKFGLINSVRLEAQYGIFGMPQPEIAYTPPAITDPSATLPPETSAPTEPKETQDAAEETVPPETEPEPVVYGYHITDIDFASLVEENAGTTLGTMDAYYGSQMPTMENQYTGMFAGKNLIYITAEAFSSPVVDKIRTPTLYRLAKKEGFVFSNFYQPGWMQSTTGGEFAVMTGLIPTWVNGNTAFGASIHNDMVLGMGWKFREQGYTCRAYHNNSFTYYDRHKTHPNLGYDYYGMGNGLELENHYSWPSSDLDMMKATVPEMVQGYLDTGVPFHTYYMTVSGHANYGFGYHDIAKKNRDVVEGMQYSETVRAYLAAQMELEYAMEYLVDYLDQAGILEDTVIVMAADHYPYAMTQGCPKDYYVEMTGRKDNETMTSRYRNTLILWCGSMKEPVHIEKPCSAIDMMPTIYNLFGIPYDSRLLSGKDIFDESVAPGEVSTAMNIVVFPDYDSGRSWITNAGLYEASVGFEPFQGVEVDENYVEQVKQIVNDRWTFARLCIEKDYFAHVYPDWEPAE